jgi:hypothetical protein
MCGSVMVRGLVIDMRIEKGMITFLVIMSFNIGNVYISIWLGYVKHRKIGGGSDFHFLFIVILLHATCNFVVTFMFSWDSNIDLVTFS